MRQSVLCTTSDVMEAEQLVKFLKSAGFTTDNISVLMPDRFGAEELGYEMHSKAPEGISVGVSMGSAIGAALGYLVGIGALWLPGSLPFFSAGPLVAALSGVAVGGAIGGVGGGLIGLRIPEYEVKKYERKPRSGSTLIAVHTDTHQEAQVAEGVLRAIGASDMHRTGEEHIKKEQAARSVLRRSEMPSPETTGNEIRRQGSGR